MRLVAIVLRRLRYPIVGYLLLLGGLPAGAALRIAPAQADATATRAAPPPAAAPRR
jgi:hypothetical protein